MAYLDIVFHNIQSKAAIYTGGPAAYVANGPNVCDGPINQAGLWGTPGAYGAPAPASAGWGPNVAAPPLPFSGVFFCEGPSYLRYAGGWTIPPIIVAPAPGAPDWDEIGRAHV